jgi:outer membrane protein assembly factor BamB
MSDGVSSQSVVWRCGGGDNSRRGLFGGAARLSAEPAGRLETSGAVQASVVFTQSGTAFVADMAGVVQAHQPGGKLWWRVQLDAGISATPAVSADDRVLFVATHHGEVRALETDSGTTVWRQRIPSKSDPRILSDLLYLPRAGLVVLSSWGGQFHALEAQTGQKRFSWEAGISPRAAAAADRAENVYCLRVRSGHGVELVKVSSRGEGQVLLRQAENPEGARRTLVAAGPVLDEERGMAYLILNKAREGELVACRMEDGTVLWRRSLPAAVQAMPSLLTGGEIVVSDLGGWLRSFSSTGAAGWSFDTGSDYLLAGGAGEGDGVFYIGDPLGQVHRINPRGERSVFYRTPRSVQARPSFDPRGRLYIPCTDHRVHVFGAGGKPQAEPPENATGKTE